MVESVTVFDEDWTDDDMSAALGWQAERRSMCTGCGFPLDETTQPGRDDAYEAELVTCHACASAERSARAFRDLPGMSVTDGVRTRIYEVD